MKKKFSFKALMLASLIMSKALSASSMEGLDPTSSSGISTVDVSQQLRQMYPNLFIGETNSDVREILRTVFKRTKEDEHAAKGFFQTPVRGSVSYKKYEDFANILWGYINELELSKEDKDVIFDHLGYHIEHKKLSGDFFWKLITSLQAAQSQDMGQYEKDWFSAFVREDYFMQELIGHEEAERPKWTYNEVSFFEKPYSFNSSSHANGQKGDSRAQLSRDMSPMLYGAHRNILNTELMKALPSETFFPVLGSSLLGVHYFIENLIDQNVPIAIPHKKSHEANVHGVRDMSPLGVSLHDIGHAVAVQRTEFLIDYAEKLFNLLPAEGILFEDAMPIVIGRTVAKNALITQTLRKVLRGIDQRAVSGELSKLQYQRALYGFFGVMHESPDVFFQSCFSAPTLDELFSSPLSRSEPITRDTQQEEGEIFILLKGLMMKGL